MKDFINEIISDIEQVHFEMSEGHITNVDYLVYLGNIGNKLKSHESEMDKEDYEELNRILNLFNQFYV